MNNHFFVVLEGLDGSGKTEVAHQISRILKNSLGDNVLHTFEPNNASVGGAWIRDVLSHKIKTTNYGLALAYALNRIDHNQHVIDPFINAGDQRVVICDRYYLSSLIYQSVDGLSMDDVRSLNREARQPDLTLFLDASAENCYQRMGKRAKKDPELFERNLAEKRQKYQRGIDYLQQRGEKIITVNADADLLTVVNNVIALINEHAPAWLHAQALQAIPPTEKKPNPLLPTFASYDAFLPFLHRISKIRSGA